MNKYAMIFLLVLLVAFTGCGGAGEDAAPEPAAVEETPAAVELTPDEQVAGMEQMCAEAAEAMTAWQAESTLFDRVGGRDGIHAVVADTVARHQVNDQIVHLMEGVDADHLVAQVTDFLVVATGGEGEYSGQDMKAAHANMALSNADFLAAGGDLGAAMEAAGWGEGESQELLCAFVGLRGDVVTQ
jgi:hemoglobin